MLYLLKSCTIALNVEYTILTNSMLGYSNWGLQTVRINSYLRIYLSRYLDQRAKSTVRSSI